MKVVETDDLYNSKRDVIFEQGRSLRIILERDNMGFSLHKTIIRAGETGHWHYKHHKEACFCISGEGKLTNLKNGQQWIISPDITYIL